jgi:hypothetical protein
MGGIIAPPQGLEPRLASFGVISPKDFGATGNGTTDDTAAWQAWVNALGTNGAGYVPAGHYSVTSMPTIPGTCRVEFAPGAILFLNGVPQHRLSYYHPQGEPINVLRETFASGSSQSTTGSITSGSNALTVASAIDFQNGQGISIANAGPLPTISAPSAPTVTATGTTGSTSWAYAVAALDGKGGETAASPVTTITNGNATLSSTNYNAISWTAVTGAAGYAVYRTTAGGTPNTTGLIAIVSGTSFDDTGVATITPPVGVSSTAPSSALGELLVTTIHGGAGTTTLTLAAAASTTVSGAAVNHDDTAAIQAAINAAETLNTAGLASSGVYFPAGDYLISSPIAITSAIDIRSNSAAVISGTASVGDAFVIGGSSGNVGFPVRMEFPWINGFVNGAGLRIRGAYAWIYSPHIGACRDGILLETSNTFTNTVNNTLECNLISGCSNGIRLTGTASSQIIQGNWFKVNFIINCTVGILFDAVQGSAPSWNLNAFDVPSIDCTNLPDSACVRSLNNSYLGPNFFRMTAFSASASKILDMGSVNQVDAVINSPGQISPAMINLIGDQNRIINVGQGVTPPFNQSPISAVTTSGNLAGFNGGVALYTNKTRIGLPVPALTSGQTADFYVFHAFTTGYTNDLAITPRYSAPFVVVAVEDESKVAGLDGNTYPNQIHIRILATGSVSAGTYEMLLTVNG